MELYNNVYTFFGSDSKVGVTMITTALGEVLSKHNNILLINANKRSGLDYIKVEDDYIGIENLQNKLLSNILEYGDLEKIIINKDNIHIISGVKELEYCRYFMPEHMDLLLKCVHDKYDLILIDSGSEFESNGLSIGALKCTPNTVFITTQQEKSWGESQRIIQLSERIGIQYKYLIVNKLQPKGSGVMDVDSIRNGININDVLGTIIHSTWGWASEGDYKSLSHFDAEFKTEIYKIADKIAFNLNLKLPEEQKKKGFSLFNRKTS